MRRAGLWTVLAALGVGWLLGRRTRREPPPAPLREVRLPPPGLPVPVSPVTASPVPTSPAPDHTVAVLRAEPAVVEVVSPAPVPAEPVLTAATVDFLPHDVGEPPTPRMRLAPLAVGAVLALGALGIGYEVLRFVNTVPVAPALVSGGDAGAGRQAFISYGCGSCHLAPGMRQAEGQVGPNLSNFANRALIAGQFGNNATALVRWIQVPQAMLPGNGMPNLGVTESDARDIAAYLYTLR